MGVGCRSRFMARFAIRMSIQSRTSPFFFGMFTIGDTHGVGPSTSSIMPCDYKCSNSSSTFLRRWNGIRLACWATGGKSLSI